MTIVDTLKLYGVTAFLLFLAYYFLFAGKKKDNIKKPDEKSEIKPRKQNVEPVKQPPAPVAPSPEPTTVEVDVDISKNIRDTKAIVKKQQEIEKLNQEARFKLISDKLQKEIANQKNPQ